MSMARPQDSTPPAWLPELKHANLASGSLRPWVPGRRRFGIRELTTDLDAGQDVDDGGVADQQKEPGEQQHQGQAHPLGGGLGGGLGVG